MRKLYGTLLVGALAGAVAVGVAGLSQPASAEADAEAVFELGQKNLFPPQVIHEGEFFPQSLHVAVGETEKEPIAQPIQFPHNRHVQVLGMDCQYCHSSARKEIHAGVPPTQLCMGCHAKIDTTNRPELDKLVQYWADGKGESIPWNRVHDLPDFVYFSHKRHVSGGVQCQECHGQMQDLEVAQRAASLKMGWCLDCHAQHESIDKNYGDKAELRRAELKDCWTCHK